jgi:hypothetical protein
MANECVELVPMMWDHTTSMACTAGMLAALHFGSSMSRAAKLKMAGSAQRI